MQYWILFCGGVGGDGFCNLLEYAKNVTPADREYGWRIHRRVGKQVKFYGCHWTIGSDKPFRTPEIVENSVLNPLYRQLIESNINTVIPAHYCYWQQIENFNHRDFIQTSQVLINLYSNDYDRVKKDFLTKNLLPDQPYLTEHIRRSIEHELSRNIYKCHIDIERAWRDWHYLDDRLKSVDINLDRCYYEEYLEIKGP